MHLQAIETRPNDLSYHSNTIAVMIQSGSVGDALQYIHWALASSEEWSAGGIAGVTHHQIARILGRAASLYAKRREFAVARD